MAPAGVDYARYPVLVVDDERDNLDAFRFNFQKQFTLHLADSGQAALELARAHDIAVVLTDQRMPGMTGLELLRELRTVRPEAVGIIVSAFTDTEVLIEAINLGQIYRYVTKPWDREELRGLLRQSIERFFLMRENRQLNERLAEYAGLLAREAHGAFNFGEIVGSSAALGEVMRRVEQVAPTASTVLLQGETGTGKELVARAIHINSPREARPFVRVNCAALAPGVLESELFGHEKGAFTGAVARRPGRFELADGGTLFLDEVGDLPMEVQIKLLRVLQEREFERVGGIETVRVDVRVISATHRDLERLIAEGKFREDLYYRLNVFSITLPPLRARKDDLPALCEHFTHKFAAKTGKRVTRFTPEALEILRQYPWPGNVRELENVIERALILAHGDVITASDLDFGRRRDVLPTPTSPATETESSPSSLAQRLSDQEKGEIERAVESAQGNIALAARMLGINRSTLYYRMRKHGLEHLLPTK